jgi:ribosomal protein S3
LEDELTQLIKVLSKLLNLKIELQLNQLKYPYMDSQILAKYIALNTNNNRFRRLFYKITRKALTAKIKPKSL